MNDAERCIVCKPHHIAWLAGGTASRCELLPLTRACRPERRDASSQGGGNQKSTYDTTPPFLFDLFQPPLAASAAVVAQPWAAARSPASAANTALGACTVRYARPDALHTRPRTSARRVPPCRPLPPFAELCERDEKRPRRCAACARRLCARTYWRAAALAARVRFSAPAPRHCTHAVLR